MIRLISLCVAALCWAPWVTAVEADDGAVSLTLPPQVELGRLVDMVGELAGVSVEYNPQRLRGQVRLDLRERYTQDELWSVFNQVLLGQGFTTVVAGKPALYHVVAINEAAALSRAILAEEIGTITPRPGYLTVLFDLEHLPPETAVQALSNMLGQSGQARTLGRDNDRVVIAGTTGKVLEAIQILELLDQKGLQPAFRQFQPKFATPQKLQSAATAAWSAGARVSGRQSPVEIQLTPDARRLLIIAPSERIDALIDLITQLDHSEPAITNSYRPRYFSPEDVAGLVEQILSNEAGGDRVKIVRDHLTGSLVVTATEAQHDRVRMILDDLDKAPATARRTMRQYQIKHRAVGDLVGVLNELITGGVTEVSMDEGAEGQANNNEQGVPDKPHAPANSDEGAMPGITPPEGRIARSRPRRTSNEQGLRAENEAGEDVVLSTDELTNTLIAFGSPRILDQLEDIINRLDIRQPQVELEITLVSLSESESISLGVELAAETASGSIEGNVASMFGITTPNNVGTATRALDDFSGLGGLVINPGDWAVAFQALEVVSEGRNVVSSRVVIDNAAEAQIDGVEQQPVSATNSNQSAAITGFGGTSDAGTQVTVTPQIGAADQVTLTYTVSQSAFIGQSIETGDGAVLPPPRRADTFSSVATVPDGHVIALGGLHSTRKAMGHRGIPWIARIPILGMLFRKQTTSEEESRFFVFIRVNVLRHPDFADLRHLSADHTRTAEIDDGWPDLEAQFIE
ncbi:MAG: hypothetical protein PF961_13500 [Planctomycetota bacterium]|jgi:type II secretory pathway component GspD/PulD (secretin)|nr:hypothetical protein [Planctomycetota bacterium]